MVITWNETIAKHAAAAVIVTSWIPFSLSSKSVYFRIENNTANTKKIAAGITNRFPILDLYTNCKTFDSIVKLKPIIRNNIFSFRILTSPSTYIMSIYDMVNHFRIKQLCYSNIDNKTSLIPYINRLHFRVIGSSKINTNM